AGRAAPHPRRRPVRRVPHHHTAARGTRDRSPLSRPPGTGRQRPAGSGAAPRRLPARRGGRDAAARRGRAHRRRPGGGGRRRRPPGAAARSRRGPRVGRGARGGRPRGGGAPRPRGVAPCAAGLPAPPRRRPRGPGRHPRPGARRQPLRRFGGRGAPWWCVTRSKSGVPGQRTDRVAGGRARPAAPVGLPPPRPRPAGDPRRLRARRVRRLHHPPGGGRRPLLPAAGPPGGGRRHHHGGRTGRRRRRPDAPPAPGGVQATLRPPVRVLHRRHPDGRRRAPRRRRHPAAGRGRDPPAPLRPPVPLHGLPADRGRHRRRRRRRRGRGGLVNLGQVLLAAAERAPDAEAVVDADRRLTYRDLLDEAARAAGGLASLGVKPRDRVAAAVRNRVETVVAYWACQWLGACLVPVNWRLKPEEIRYCAADAEAAAFFAEAHLVEDTGARPWTDLVPGDPAAGPPDVADGEPSLMLYTSGTTGRPKGVPRSQRAEWAAALAHVIQCRYGRGERTLGVMPLYHRMADRSLLAMHAVAGCFVIRPEFRPAEAVDVIAAERIGALYLAPTLYHDLVDVLDAGRRRLPVPRLAYAGAPMSPTLVERCAAAFEPEVFVNHYGSTEIYTFSVHGDQRAKPGCAGRPGVHGRLRLVPLDGGAAAEGNDDGVGEILAALDSDEAFGGYWHRPDADARALTTDGWYRTGD